MPANLITKFNKNRMVSRVEKITNRITMNCLGTKFTIRVEEDLVSGGRVFIQAIYKAVCTKTGKIEEWHGRKWYLSTHMTDDEIVKTSWCAFEAAVKHEVMEGFKVDGIILFNPHVNYAELLSISKKEIRRKLPPINHQ